MKKFKNQKNKKSTKDIQLPNEKIQNIIQQNFYQTQIEKINNIDADINHLEKIFTDETYYAAMKIVPLIERKVLYLSYIENARLNDICKRLKLQKSQVIRLRNQAIRHFKNNLETLYKANNIKVEVIADELDE